MKKIYHLATCSTNQRILKEINVSDKGMLLQEIKSQPITAQQLDELKDLAGNYESLFSRKAIKFRTMGLHEKTLTEKDYRDLLLQEYTFLKRPVAVVNNKVFIGSAKATIEALKAALGS
jgi:arsenate reductase